MNPYLMVGYYIFKRNCENILCRFTINDLLTWKSDMFYFNKLDMYYFESILEINVIGCFCILLLYISLIFYLGFGFINNTSNVIFFNS